MSEEQIIKLMKESRLDELKSILVQVKSADIVSSNIVVKIFEDRIAELSDSLESKEWK